MIRTLGFASVVPLPCVEGTVLFPYTVFILPTIGRHEQPVQPKRMAERNKPSLRAAGIALVRNSADITIDTSARQRETEGTARYVGQIELQWRNVN
jgi:hypothetical protein